MSLDVFLLETGNDDPNDELYWANITHNLNNMASHANLYKALWRPDENGIEKAKDLIPILIEGIKNMIDNRDELQEYNPDNGWGNYENLLEFSIEYLYACWEYPEAFVKVSR